MQTTLIKMTALLVDGMRMNAIVSKMSWQWEMPSRSYKFLFQEIKRKREASNEHRDKHIIANSEYNNLAIHARKTNNK